MGPTKRYRRLKNRIKYSFVIPSFNEAESLPTLVAEIWASMEKLCAPSQWELLIIDDGSTDNTESLLHELSKQYPQFRAILFRKNFGKSAALMAGFERAQGDFVITMDADLQDNPKELIKLIAKVEEGFDLVSGWKQNRQDPVEKTLPSRFFNYVVSRVSKVHIHDFNCGFKIYRHWCIKTMQIRGNQHRFIPAILSWQGARIAEVPVEHRKRQHGKSKYGMARYFHGSFDLMTLILLTKFSQNPLYLFGLIALPMIFLSVCVGGYLLGDHILYLISPSLGAQLNTRPLLVICSSLFLIGLQIFLIGLLSELVLRASNLGRGFAIRETIEPSQNPDRATSSLDGALDE
jgi:glycosyltransferase involved in cell wall biosynthesis